MPIRRLHGRSGRHLGGAALPREQTGQAYRLGGAADGASVTTTRRGASPGIAIPVRSAALRHFREAIEPELRATLPLQAVPTFEELCERFLERHAAARSRARFGLSESGSCDPARFGALPLEELDPGRSRISRRACRSGGVQQSSVR